MDQRCADCWKLWASRLRLQGSISGGPKGLFPTSCCPLSGGDVALGIAAGMSSLVPLHLTQKAWGCSSQG